MFSSSFCIQTRMHLIVLDSSKRGSTTIEASCFGSSIEMQVCPHGKLYCTQYYCNCNAIILLHCRRWVWFLIFAAYSLFWPIIWGTIFLFLCFLSWTISLLHKKSGNKLTEFKICIVVRVQFLLLILISDLTRIMEGFSAILWIFLNTPRIHWFCIEFYWICAFWVENPGSRMAT